jgi:predicted lipoprotein with Yx(FWY)xxD motif
MKLNLLKSSTLFALTLVVGLASCSKDNNNSPYNAGNPSQNQPQPPAATAAVQLATNAKFGSILTDKAGRSLYSFAIDAGNQSNCNGNCAVTWPAFNAADASVATGLNTADFGTITRADGSKQTTYKGWPLYYFSGDAKAGDTNGDGVGKTWFISKPDYTVMLANQQLTGNDGVLYNSKYVPGTEVVQYITDDRGRTLYSFIKDKANTNTYTKADFSNNSVWPINEIAKVLNVPSILDKSQFGTTTVFGKTQLTFKGWPMYFFGADGGIKGNNKGVSVGPGAWPVENTTTVAAPAN